jgi:hypothetical protein
MRGLDFRLVDLDTGAVIVEHAVDTLDAADVNGQIASFLANTAVDQGRFVTLQVRDPDALVAAAEWTDVCTVGPA